MKSIKLMVIMALVALFIACPLGRLIALYHPTAYALTKEEAKRKAEEKEKIKEEEIAKHYQLGVKYYREGDLLGTIDEFEKVLSLDPEHRVKKSLIKIQRKLRKVIIEPGFSYNKGIEYYMEGKYNLAIGQWEKVLILEPGYKRASQYIQKTQEKLKKIVQAERAQERKSQIAQHYRRGCNFYQAGNMKGAMQEFQAVLRLNPNHQGAQEYLAKIGTSLAPKEKPTAGEEPIVAAEPKPEVDPAEIAEHYNKGLEAYQNGQLTAALKEWEKVLELDPNHKKAQRNIEEVKKELEAVERK